MPPLLAYFQHNLDPYLIRFSENFGIKYYGLAYALGFLCGGVLLYIYWRRGRSPLNPEGQSDLLLGAMIGTLVGGRLGYFLFYSPETFFRDPLTLIRVWDGGMASHGGFIGVVLGMWWASRKHKLPFVAAGDLMASLAPPGLLFGRLANFINGELWGKETTVPWAVEFPIRDAAENIIGHEPPRHPSQLYEAALEGLLLLVYTQWRLWRTPVLKEQPGRLAGEFLLGYAIVRVIAEQFREPDPGIATPLGINRGAWLSLALAAAGVCLIVRGRQTRARLRR
jgi:phosphatidylglycerol---prolipoprotein diacylglyceryl transferase